MQPMLDAGERLSRAWGIVGHLHSVNDVPPWREAYNAMLPEVSGFYADLGQNLALFAKFKALAAGPEFATLSPARRRIIENEATRFSPVRRRTGGRQEAALQGNPGRAVGAGGEVLRERARCHQRPRRVDSRRS